MVIDDAAGIERMQMVALSFQELALAVLVNDLAELFQAEEDDQGVGTETREGRLYQLESQRLDLTRSAWNLPHPEAAEAPADAFFCEGRPDHVENRHLR